MHNGRGTNYSFTGILIHAYLTFVLDRLEVADNGQNTLGETMEISGKPELNTAFKFSILE